MLPNAVVQFQKSSRSCILQHLLPENGGRAGKLAGFGSSMPKR